MCCVHARCRAQAAAFLVWRPPCLRLHANLGAAGSSPSGASHGACGTPALLLGPLPPARRARQVFEGRDGAKAPDFEAFHASTAHTSPLLYDIDLDGVPDILLATYNGEILFFKDTVGALCRPRRAAIPLPIQAAVLLPIQAVVVQTAGSLGSRTACLAAPWLKPRPVRALQGEEAAQRLTVPRLRVRRDWHQGLNPDAVDHT